MNDLTITKITLTGLNPSNMGDASEADAAGYRTWLRGELRREYPGVELDLRAEDSTYGTAVEVEDQDHYYAAMDDVHGFVEQCWDRCPWSWVE